MQRTEPVKVATAEKAKSDWDDAEPVKTQAALPPPPQVEWIEMYRSLVALAKPGLSFQWLEGMDRYSWMKDESSRLPTMVRLFFPSFYYYHSSPLSLIALN